MALQPGFDRYEGLAFFGYTRDGDGHDAIVNVGENFIEIKNGKDQVLSIWAPRSFECNNLEMPMRAYFSGDEWIAPRDRELADFLDQYLAIEPISDENYRIKRPKWQYALVGLVVLCVITLGGYIIMQTSLTRLIDPSIALRMDGMIAQTKFTSGKICDTETEPILRDFLREKAPEPNFKVVENLGADFARMPSGMLVINQEWVSQFSGEDTLIALINLAHVRNQDSNPARVLVELLPLNERIKFLQTGQLTQAQIDMVWPIYISQAQIFVNDIQDIDDPIGNFAELAELAHIPTTSALPNIQAGLEFGDQDWLTMITLCPNEPLG